MRRGRTFRIGLALSGAALVVLAAAGLALAVVFAGPSPEAASQGHDQEVLVKLRNPSKAAETLGTLPTKGKYAALDSGTGKSGLYVLRPADGDRAALIERLRGNPNVEYAQPNYRYRILLSPNDGYYGIQSAALGWINAPLAWDRTTGSAQAVVAVIDTGIDTTHADLAANIWRNPGEIAGNGADDDGNGLIDDVNGWNYVSNGPNVADDNSHGTHCAGIIGAVGNNGAGIAGVNWTVRLLAVKVLDGGGSGYTSNIVRAIDYLTALRGAGINVVAANCSFGGYDYDTALRDAIARAGAAGILFSCAAGNESNDNDSAKKSYPASYGLSNILSVAALNEDGSALASFSNYGATSVHLAAPGSRILSAIPGNRFAYMSGTSMATPFVAGEIALARSAYPSLSAEGLRATILGAVTSRSGLSGKVSTGGLIDLARAVGSTGSPTGTPSPTPAATPTPAKPTPTPVRPTATITPRPTTTPRPSPTTRPTPTIRPTATPKPTIRPTATPAPLTVYVVRPQVGAVTSLYPVLYWDVSGRTTSVVTFNVYVGTSAGKMTRVLANTPNRGAYFVSPLRDGQTYYWRVEAMHLGRTYAGAVWNFRASRTGRNWAASEAFEDSPILPLSADISALTGDPDDPGDGAQSRDSSSAESAPEGGGGCNGTSLSLPLLILLPGLFLLRSRGR